LSSHSVSKEHRRETAFFPKVLYKGRARIEQAVGKVKRFKRIALRCEKDREKLRLSRRTRLRIHLDQIRPHGLGLLHTNIDVSITTMQTHIQEIPGRSESRRLFHTKANFAS
jgi:hypothetical protein